VVTVVKRPPRVSRIPLTGLATPETLADNRDVTFEVVGQIELKIKAYLDES
jgi:hypothetical protein